MLGHNPTLAAEEQVNADSRRQRLVERVESCIGDLLVECGSSVMTAHGLGTHRG